VDPNADEVAGMHRLEVEWFERLVDDPRTSVSGGSGRREHEQPPRRDHADAKRQVTGVDQMDGHSSVQCAEEIVDAAGSRWRRKLVVIITFLRGPSRLAEAPRLRHLAGRRCSRK
jgi:hypothetical protein